MTNEKQKTARLVIVAVIAIFFGYIWFQQKQARSRTADTLALVNKVLKESKSNTAAVKPVTQAAPTLKPLTPLKPLAPTKTNNSRRTPLQRGSAPNFQPAPAPIRRPAPLPMPTKVASSGLPPGRLTPLEREDLLQRNPFKINRDKPAPPTILPKPTKPAVRAPTAPPKPINLKLVGTICGPMVSWAAIYDMDNKSEAFYEPGAPINENAKLLTVERSAVTVLINGKQERLTIDWQGTQQAALPRARARRHTLLPKPNNRGVLAAPKLPADSTVSVSKADLNKNFRNLSQLLTQMRVQPFFEKGKPSGFLISSVRRGSFVERLGARSGDIIRQINGEKVDSVQKAFKLYNAFKNNNSVQVTITRQGRPHTLNFAMQ